MKIERTSPFTGQTVEMDLDITPQQYQQWLNGQLVQNAFPNLNADQREFIMTGITPEEWDAFVGRGYDDEGTDEAEYIADENEAIGDWPAGPQQPNWEQFKL